jgi:predicted transcriptional regulator
MSLLPVRTHRWIPISGHNQGRPTFERTRQINAQVLALKARGRTRIQIAEELGITPATVGRHFKGTQKCL